jgi:hypothetical protein
MDLLSIPRPFVERLRTCKSAVGPGVSLEATGHIDPASDCPVVCRACGWPNEAGSNQCARPTCRKALLRNGLSRKTGLKAVPSTPQLQVIEAAGRDLVEQSIIDAGGREELTARELADHQYRGLLHVNVLKLAAALETHGQFDKRGRLRKGWLELLDRLISSAVGIDKTLGLRRKAKRVQTLEDYLDAREREQQR